MGHAPWSSGPGEILEHALELLSHDSERNRRLAMISVDNSVELMLKTFLGLPKRVTKLEIPRKDRDEFFESFPKLLDAIESHAPDLIAGVDLGEIEWYHRLRNQLYHQGNGLTVEKEKVTAYSELAVLLFKRLFGVDIAIKRKQSEQQKLLGMFLESWVELERTSVRIYEKLLSAEEAKRNWMRISDLSKHGVLTANEATNVRELQQLRNRVVHGQDKAQEELTAESIQHVQQLTARLQAKLNQLQQDLG
jgi:hypothetical protein